MKIEKVVDRYNRLMLSLGLDHKTIGTAASENTEGLGIADMVEEVKYWRSLYFEEGNDLCYYRQTHPREAKNDISRMDRFIRRYHV